MVETQNCLGLYISGNIYRNIGDYAKAKEFLEI
jgi:hypothetical protein